MAQAIPAFLSAAFISLIVTPLVRLLAVRWGLVDDARKRPHPAHTHTGIIPRAGGLAIYLGTVAAILLFLPLTKLVIGIIIAATILTLVGLIDDKGDVSPYLRLATNTTAALIVIGSGAGIPYITNPVTGGIIHLDTWRLSFDFWG